ncbi:MAG: PQQ-binding-like beta-propeller repeat protein, partial [bacterium]|nr:PQQ-binding-like beta-propeller repeat protein [bacterium]
ASLRLLWRTNPDPNCVKTAQAVPVVADEASPLVANGAVYVADVCGVVSALNRDTGSLIWQRSLPVSSGVAGVWGTPMLADGRLFIPVWGTTTTSGATGGYLAALDAMSGATLWMTQPLAHGNMRGEPLVVNGRVFQGISGGDLDTGYVSGGVAAFDEGSGQPIPNAFSVVPSCTLGTPCLGGASWSPISYDGQKLYFGTGNTKGAQTYQDSVLALEPSTLTLSVQVGGATTYDGASEDEDVGGGQLIWGGNLYFEGKNGNYYGYSLLTPNGPPFIHTKVNGNIVPGNGAIWTPTTDGSVIAVSSGYNTCATGNGCFNMDLDLFPVGGGSKTCSFTESNPELFSYAAFVKGIGFAALDNDIPAGGASAAPTFIAFDDGCHILWQASPTDLLGYFYAGPAVVPSGVYAVDNLGDVYSWKLPSMVGASVLRRTAGLIRPGRFQHILSGHFVPARFGPHHY